MVVRATCHWGPGRNRTDVEVQEIFAGIEEGDAVVKEVFSTYGCGFHSWASCDC